MSEQGIDLGKSGWENPEGFKPRERDHVPPAPPACEAEGPNGWVCDLAKGHPGNAHHADTGPTWPMAGRTLDATTANDMAHRMAMDVQDAEIVEPDMTLWTDAEVAQAALLDVNTTAQAALTDPSPANWAIALQHIVEISRGY